MQKKLNEFKEMPWASLEIYLSQQQQNIIITVAVNSSDGVGEGCADICADGLWIEVRVF